MTEGPFARLGILGLVVFTTACAHVSQGDFDEEMARIRQEMESGDQAVETRLDARVDGIESRTEALETRMGQLEGALRELEAEFDVTVERLETAIRFNTPIHFGFDEDRVDEAQVPVLGRFASVIQEYYPGALVTVEGFTDPAGSEAYNMALGQRRADHIRDWLITSGDLLENRVRSVSYGEDTRRLVREGAAGPGKAGRENRRVVLVVEHAPEASAIVTEGGMY